MLKLEHLKEIKERIPDKKEKRALKEKKIKRNTIILTEVYKIYEIDLEPIHNVILMILNGEKLINRQINYFIMNDTFFTCGAFSCHLEYLAKGLIEKYKMIPIKVFIRILKAIDDVLSRVNNYLFIRNHNHCINTIRHLHNIIKRIK